MKRRGALMRMAALGALLCGGPSFPEGLSNHQIYQLNRRSVLKLHVTCTLFDKTTIEKRSGTGFLISKQGHVITSYHLIGDPEDCESLEIHGSIRNLGDPFTYDTVLRIVPVISNFDVALLQVQKPLASEPIALRQLQQPEILEDFVFLTYSLSHELAGTPSTVRGPPQIPSVWQTNHSFNPGDSGAPILDRNGRAIGLVLGRVANANFGSGPIDVEDVGWMVSTIPAINDLVAGASAQDATVRFADSVAQPTFAVETFRISLEPKRALVGQLCPPGRGCLPVLEDGAPLANQLTRSIAAPANSVIDNYSFKGVQRGGSLALNFKGGRELAELRASVAASESALISGELKVFYAPLLIQMAYPVDITKADHHSLFGPHTRRFEKRLLPEGGYRFVKAEFRSQSVNNATAPQPRISESGSELVVTTAITSGPIYDRFRGWVHGVVLTTQERIPEAIP
jgi:hypothetical protein